MATHAAVSGLEHEATKLSTGAIRYAVPLGRVLFAAIFILSGVRHFGGQGVDYAASNGVPLASLLVPLSGVLALLGGLSILFGYHARVGAWLIILFLIPVTLMMHRFWAETDPMRVQMQAANFLKNISILGGAFFLAYFGAGPMSIDARRAAAKSPHVS